MGNTLDSRKYSIWFSVGIFENKSSLSETTSAWVVTFNAYIVPFISKNIYRAKPEPVTSGPIPKLPKLPISMTSMSKRLFFPCPFPFPSLLMTTSGRVESWQLLLLLCRKCPRVHSWKLTLELWRRNTEDLNSRYWRRGGQRPRVRPPASAAAAAATMPPKRGRPLGSGSGYWKVREGKMTSPHQCFNIINFQCPYCTRMLRTRRELRACKDSHTHEEKRRVEKEDANFSHWPRVCRICEREVRQANVLK